MEATQVNKKAAKVLEFIYQSMFSGEFKKDGGSAKIKKSQAYMPVHVRIVNTVKRLHIFSVAHYGEQNGDLMADPEATFLRRDEKTFIPLTFRSDYIGLNREYAEVDNEAEVKLLMNKYLQADLAVFCGVWMKNINEQQELDIK